MNQPFGDRPFMEIPISYYHPLDPEGLLNRVRGEAGRGAGIVTLAGRAGQGTSVASIGNVGL